MFHLKSTGRARRAATQLRIEVRRLCGIEVSVKAALAAAARLYGHADFAALERDCAARPAASAFDEDCPPGDLARRHEGQRGVLAALGVPDDRIADVLALVRPTSGAVKGPRLERVSVPAEASSEVANEVAVSLGMRAGRRELLGLARDTSGCTAFMKTSIAALLGDSSVLDPPFYEGLLKLHAAGVTPRQILAEFGATVQEVADEAFEDEVAEDVVEEISVAAHEFSEAVGPARQVEDDAEDSLNTVAVAMAFAFCDAHGDAATADETLNQFHLDLLDIEAAGATAQDVAVGVAVVSGYHPISSLIEAGFDLDLFLAVGDIGNGPACRGLDYAACDAAVTEAAGRAIRLGLAREIWEVGFEPDVFNDGVVRGDGSVAIVGDLLAHAALAGASLGDLAEMIVSVGAADEKSDVVALYAGKWGDRDLAAVVICGDWSATDGVKSVASMFARLHKGGLTLLDLLAQFLVVEALEQDESGGLIAVMEADGLLVAPTVVEGGVAGFFALLASALATGKHESDYDAFVASLRSVAQGLTSGQPSAVASDAGNRLGALSSHRKPTAVIDIIEAMASLEVALGASGAPRHRVEVLAGVAGLALGAARFLCQFPDDPDENMPEVYRLSPSEIALLTLEDLDKNAALAAAAPLAASEVATLSASSQTARNMREVLDDDADRAAEVEFFRTSRDLGNGGSGSRPVIKSYLHESGATIH